MNYLNYEDIPELENVRVYFTQVEWKGVCKSMYNHDKANLVNDADALDWIKRMLRSYKLSYAVETIIIFGASDIIIEGVKVNKEDFVNTIKSRIAQSHGK